MSDNAIEIHHSVGNDMDKQRRKANSGICSGKSVAASRPVILYCTRRHSHLDVALAESDRLSGLSSMSTTGYGLLVQKEA